jgi:hypothetical protein
MEKFPKLEQNQVALLRADVNTGIVLDDNYAVATKDIQNVYSIYDSMDDSIKYIKSVFNIRDDIEFVIYDFNNEVIQCISINNLEDIVGSDS